LRITRRIIAPIFSADVLSARFVRRLFLAFLVANDALLRWASVLGPRHAGLAAMLAAHVPFAFQIVCFCHFENSGWPPIVKWVILGNAWDRRWSFDCGLKRVGGACRRTFILVAQLLFGQVPKFSFPTFGPARLLPKLIRSRVDFLFAGFSHYVFSVLEHGPHSSGVLELARRNVRDQLRNWPFRFKSTWSRWFLAKAAQQDSCATRPPPNKTKAMRALHRMAFAGTVPLLAKIPSPLA
jgi:hypothetical protein